MGNLIKYNCMYEDFLNDLKQKFNFFTNMLRILNIFANSRTTDLYIYHYSHFSYQKVT